MARVPEAALLEYLAVLVRKLAGDVRGFDLRRRSRSTLARTVRSHLLSACHELIAGVRALDEARDPYLERQCRRALRECGVDGAQPLKIQLGGGPVRLNGWVDFGFAPADVVLDVTWGLPLPEGCASFLFCAHVLEHLDYPDAARNLLVEVRRVLRPGGVLRLIVPDMERYLSAYAGRDRGFFRGRAAMWPESRRARTGIEPLLTYAGAGNPPNDFFGHKFGYDFETLKLLLRDAGFARIRRSDYMKSEHRELRVDHASGPARAAQRGVRYSLFVEASRGRAKG